MMTSTALLEELNPGIREVVRFLREHDFDTCDSGDGVEPIAKNEGEMFHPHSLASFVVPRSITSHPVHLSGRG